MEADQASATPLIDAWRAEVGDQAIADAVQRARRQIEDGTLTALNDKGSLVQYLRDRRRRPA